MRQILAGHIQRIMTSANRQFDKAQLMAGNIPGREGLLAAVSRYQGQCRMVTVTRATVTVTVLHVSR